MPPRPKTQKPTPENLMEAYMQTALETGSFPVSVYSFCKEHGWEEAEFYARHGSLEGLRKAIWNTFFDQALQRLDAARRRAHRAIVITHAQTQIDHVKINI